MHACRRGMMHENYTLLGFKHPHYQPSIYFNFIQFTSETIEQTFNKQRVFEENLAVNYRIDKQKLYTLKIKDKKLEVKIKVIY